MNNKVLILNPVGFIGGAEISLLSFIKLNPDLIYKVIVPFPGKLTEELEKLKIDYEIVYAEKDFNSLSRKRISLSSFLHFLKYAFTLKKHIDNKRFDVIYTNGIKMHLTGCILSFIVNRKIVWHFRDIMENKYIRCFFYFLSIFTKKVICNSKLTKKQFPGFKTTIIHNSIESPNSIPRSDHISKKIGIVAHLTKIKNIDIAIETMKYLDDEYTLHIYGEEPYLTQASYKEVLKRLSETERVSKRIFFHGFVKEQSKIYYSCDLFLSLSQKESFGRTPLEAMAYHKPVLTSATGIFSKKTCLPFVLPFEALSPKRISEKIKEVFDDYYNFSLKCNSFWMKNKNNFDIIKNNNKIKKVILC